MLYKIDMGANGEATFDAQSVLKLADDSALSRRPSVAQRRLLLVEDDFSLRAHLAELLMHEGYYVGCAADGAEALRRLETEPLPDAILLDIMLPRVNGITFRETQLQSQALRTIPTVAITSLQDPARLGGLDFAGIFRKPVDFDLLLETIGRLCPRT